MSSHVIGRLIDAPRTLDALLEKHHVGVPSRDVIRLLDFALSASGQTAPTSLSDDQVDYLSRHGGPGMAEELASWDPDHELEERVRIAGAYLARMLHSTLSPSEAAAALDVDRSRISHRVKRGTLWSVVVGSSRRIPRWQIVEGTGETIPGLPQLVRAIPDEVDPLTVDTFMRTPQPEFDDLDPVHYLLSGRDPAPVAAFLADLGRW